MSFVLGKLAATPESNSTDFYRFKQKMKNMLREETKRIWQVLLVAFTWGLFGIGIREQVIILRLFTTL